MIASTRTDEEVREQILGVGDSLPASIRLDFFRFSTELKSEFGRGPHTVDSDDDRSCRNAC